MRGYGANPMVAKLAPADHICLASEPVVDCELYVLTENYSKIFLWGLEHGTVTRLFKEL